MNLFGVGGWELILVGILAILVFGPERMARYAFQFGRWMRKFSVICRDSVGTLRDQLGEEIGFEVSDEDIAMLNNLRNLDLQKQLGLRDVEIDPSDNGGADPKPYTAWASTESSSNIAEVEENEEKEGLTPATTEEGDKSYSAWVPPRKLT